MIVALLRSQLASKRLLREHRLSQEAYEYLLGEVHTRFFQAQSHAGGSQLPPLSLTSSSLTILSFMMLTMMPC